MNPRIDIIQQSIDHLSAHTYLEIGVAAAETLLTVQVPRKVGVDPKKSAPALRAALAPGIIESYQMTSDTFFADLAPALFREHLIDVAFVDGLHEWRQAVRDVENVLRYLAYPGIIVMHDCNPTDELIATPLDELNRRRADGTWPGGSWCGDTFKAVAWLQATRPDLRVFVLDCDWGLGIVTRGVPENRLDLSPERVQALTYADLARQRADLLNLKDPSYFRCFLECISPSCTCEAVSYTC